MKPGHPLCEACWHNPRRPKTVLLKCKEGITPVATIDLSPFSVPQKLTGKKNEHYFDCAHAFCDSGIQFTRGALKQARGQLHVDKGVKKNADGSIEFLNQGKRRRVYPDGTVMLRRGRKWIELGKITLPSDTKGKSA